MNEIDKKYFRTDDISIWWDPDDGKFSEYLHGNSKIKAFHDKILKDFLENVDFIGKCVLDCGVGKGRFAVNMMINGAAGVTGLDINERMLEITKQRCPAVKTVLGDIENMVFPSSWFDVVSCMETLIHVPDKEKAICEMARVVKNDGCVVINVQSGYSYLGYLEFYGVGELVSGAVRLVKMRLCGNKHHTKLIRKKDIETLLSSAGLRVEKEIQYGRLFTILTTYICRKV